MSTLTSFTPSDASAGATRRGIPRHRGMAVAFGILCLAMAAAVGIVLISQASAVTDQSVLPSDTAVTASSDPAVTQAAVAPRLSPWRDAWYLEDQSLPVSDPPVATSAAPATTGTLLEPTRPQAATVQDVKEDRPSGFPMCPCGPTMTGR